MQGVSEKMKEERRYEVSPEIEALEKKYALDLGLHELATSPGH